MPKKKELSFEENLAQLEQIVAKLEGGNATLEEIMADYTQGVELSASCFKALKKAEKQIDVLIKENESGIEQAPLVIEEER